MRHRLLLAATVCFCAAVTTTAGPQNGSSESSAQTPGQPAAGTAAQASATDAPARAKKVWTNEDVPALRGGDPISTFHARSGEQVAKPAPVSKNSKALQARIAQLEAQIPPLDEQIGDLQSAIDGKPTGDGKTSQRPRGVKADDWGVELQELQQKRQSIVDQIAALKDQARHQGVAPNTLP